MFKKYAEELVEKGEAYYCFCDKERLEEVRAIQEASGIAPMLTDIAVTSHLKR